MEAAPGSARPLGRAYMNNLKKPWQFLQLARLDELQAKAVANTTEAGEKARRLRLVYCGV